jgi:hypothetical protein
MREYLDEDDLCYEGSDIQVIILWSVIHTLKASSKLVSAVPMEIKFCTASRTSAFRLSSRILEVKSN